MSELGRLSARAAVLAVVFFTPAGAETAEESGQRVPVQENDCGHAVATLATLPKTIDLGSEVVVGVGGLTAWLECEGRTPGDLRLFLGGRELESVRPAPPLNLPSERPWSPTPGRIICSGAAPGSTSHEIRFALTNVTRTDDTWEWLLENHSGVSTIASVSIGLTGKTEALSSAPGSLCASARKITLVNPHLMRWAIAGMIGVLIAMYLLAVHSGLLRDEGGDSDPKKRPYSLARVQMAWWTILILSGFIAVSLIQGAITDIPSGLIGLLGISAGTFVASRFIAPPNGARAVGRGIVNDLLADEQGAITLHRFQIALWTLALGIMFVADICGRLEMRELPTNLLGLMGISNGVYLGFKAKE